MLNCLCFERPDEIGNCYKETQNRHTCLAGDVKTLLEKYLGPCQTSMIELFCENT